MTATAMADAGPLLKLFAWLSPAFPTGGFSYSHGLEQAISSGAVVDSATLQDWIGDLLESGGGWADAVLMTEAWQAVTAGDRERLQHVASLAAALPASRERALETLNQGDAFLKAAASWPAPQLAWLGNAGDGRVALPVAIGTATAAHGVPLLSTLTVYLQAFAANLVSVAVRLVPLGQSAGLAVLAATQPSILRLAEKAAASTLDDLGTAAILSDIAAMRHETQYSRIFRS